MPQDKKLDPAKFDAAVEAMKDQFITFAKQQGRELKGSAEELARYTVEVAEKLALAAGEPGFEQALVAARNAVTLRAATIAVTQADASDERLKAFIQGSLGVLAQVVVAAL